MDEKYLKMLKGLDNLEDAKSILDVFLDYCGDIIITITMIPFTHSEKLMLV